MSGPYALTAAGAEIIARCDDGSAAVFEYPGGGLLLVREKDDRDEFRGTLKQWEFHDLLLEPGWRITKGSAR